MGEKDVRGGGGEYLSEESVRMFIAKSLLFNYTSPTNRICYSIRLQMFPESCVPLLVVRRSYNPIPVSLIES